MVDISSDNNLFKNYGACCACLKNVIIASDNYLVKKI